MSTGTEIVKPSGKVPNVEPMSLEQFQTLSIEEQMYAVYRSNVDMQNKMIDLENQAQVLSDPGKLMEMVMGAMGGGIG